MVKIKTIVEVLAYRHALVMPTKSEAPRELEFPRGFCAQHHVRRWRALGLILGELLPIVHSPYTSLGAVASRLAASPRPGSGLCA